MKVPRVSIEMPPGIRSWGQQGVNTCLNGRDASGAAPIIRDFEHLRRQFPSEESREMYFEHVRQRMRAIERGDADPDWVVKMEIAPDVLELKFQDWSFSNGVMQGRLYFSEPRALPGHLVFLRLLHKRPGPIGVRAQDGHARIASDLLLACQQRGFQ